MQLFIKIFCGKTIVIDVGTHDTIFELKSKIIEKAQYAKALQSGLILRLLKGVEVNNTQTIGELNIPKETTLYCHYRRRLNLN